MLRHQLAEASGTAHMQQSNMKPLIPSRVTRACRLTHAQLWQQRFLKWQVHAAIKGLQQPEQVSGLSANQAQNRMRLFFGNGWYSEAGGGLCLRRVCLHRACKPKLQQLGKTSHVSTQGYASPFLGELISSQIQQHHAAVHGQCIKQQGSSSISNLQQDVHLRLLPT